MSETTNKQTSGELQEENFCTRRTRSEILLAAALVGVVTYFIYYKSTLPVHEEIEVCDKAVCFETFLEINDFIDESTNPCEDFHQFACGSFLHNAHIKQIFNIFISEQDEISNEIKGYILRPISDDDSTQIVFAKKFFQTCLNTSAIDDDQDQTFLTMIDEIGGWPVLKGQNWNEEEFDWMSVMVRCIQLGLPAEWFLKIDLYSEEEKNYLKLTYPIRNDDSLQNDYEKLIVDVVTGLSGSVVKAEQEMNTILDFDKKLLNVSQNNKAEVLLMTVEELQETFPKYNWLDFLNNITEGHYEFTNDSQIATNIYSYIEELDHLLVNTPTSVQADYIVWSMINYFGPYLSSPTREKFERPSLQSSFPYNNRTEICWENAQKFFPYVTESEFIRKHVTSSVRSSVKEMTNLIREEFTARLKNVKWITEETVQWYLSKFRTTVTDVGGHEKIFDEAFFDKNYLHLGCLNFTSENLTIINMVTERVRCQYDSILSGIGQPGIDNKVVMYSVYFNYYPEYNGKENRLFVPVRSLYKFLYDEDRPRYLNYGSLGTLIGRAFVQGLLDTLKEDDSNTTDIWTHKDYKVYENGTACFENDYIRNWREELSLNSSEIISKAISEIIGKDLAYSAYQKWKESNDEPNFIELSYDENQLFWIKSSLLNCYTDLYDEKELAITKLRNILSSRHLEQFAQDFGCKTGTQMNPEDSKKCWLFL